MIISEPDQWLSYDTKRFAFENEFTVIEAYKPCVGVIVVSGFIIRVLISNTGSAEILKTI